MFGYIYKIIHIPSGKFYIGQHKATEFDENYWGSGRIIKDYIKTHPIEEFKREVLCWCKTFEELQKKEKEYIKPHFGSNLCMNRTTGGDACKFSEESIELLRKSHKGQISPQKGKHLSKETREKLSKAIKKYGQEHPGWQAKENNPMFGRKGAKHPQYQPRVRIYKECPICYKLIIREVLPRERNNKFCCCKEHQRQYALQQAMKKITNPRFTLHCEYRGKKFVWHKKKVRRFCSRDCHYKSRRKKK